MAKKTKKKTKKVARRTEAAPAPDALLAPAPKSLGEITGQDAAVSVLSRAFASGRLHHAWIFHGPRGVGKRTTALAFAAALLDPTTTVAPSGLPTPDPESHVAGLLASGAHPDLHLITKELARYSDNASVRSAKLSTIPKDVVETRLIKRIPLAPSVTDHGEASRVFIVDEAELLDRSPTNAPVQNALLKTLEEPPPGAVLILVTDSDEKLLPTIRSRCQRVAFATLRPEALRAWADGAEAGEPEFAAAWRALPAPDQQVLLDYAEGSPGRLVEAVGASVHTWHAALDPLVQRALDDGLPVTLGKTISELVSEWADAQLAKDKNASKTVASARGMELAQRVIVAGLRRRLHDGARSGDASRVEEIARTIEAVTQASKLQSSSVATAFVCDAIASSLMSR